MRRDPPFHPHPDVTNDPDFEVVTIDVARAVQSYRKSLLAYEWINPDGTIKSAQTLSPDHAASRTRIEAQFKSGRTLSMPIIGWGMFDCLEIGSGRDIFLTIAAMGAHHIPVHVPKI